ncbi:hypothetical protein CsatA_025823 [Cannabis sativa]
MERDDATIEQKKALQRKRRRELYAQTKESRNKHRREVAAKKRMAESNKSIRNNSRKIRTENMVMSESFQSEIGSDHMFHDKIGHQRNIMSEIGSTSNTCVCRHDTFVERGK